MGPTHPKMMCMRAWRIFIVAFVTLLFAFAACDDESDTDGSLNRGSTGGDGGADGGAGTGGLGGGGDLFMNGGNGPFYDFPEDPVIEGTLPASTPELFSAATTEDTGGPCLSEPAIEAMVPRNWSPLLFEWSADAALTVFEIQLTVANQVNPLIVYTTSPNYTIDAEIWEGLTSNSAGEDINVTIRGAGFDGTVLTTPVRAGSAGPIFLAPVAAPGSVVYWNSSAGTAFMGFEIGDTVPKTVLTPAAAGMSSTGGDTTCVSCHTSSPDGKLLIYSRDANNGTRAVDVRNIDGTTVDPASVSPAALTLLGRHKQTAPVMSAAHYSATDAIAITVLSDPGITGGSYELVWTDLHATDAGGWGVLPRMGDAQNVSSPSWSHDGNTIAYVSSAGGGEGVIAASPMDIYTVPYNDKLGGTATPLAGASDPNFVEFYPVFAPDDMLLAFNRSDQPVSSYNQPSAELFVLPAAGGTAERLRANDPPVCTGQTSPGLTNSWARWAPQSETFGELKYYWIVFSSKRRANSAFSPQLYVAAITTRLEGATEVIEKQYPAIYVVAQDPLANNHTPAWDKFEVGLLPPD